jgi:putative tryptophan/tyrosine transport system substrate-binding protein
MRRRREVIGALVGAAAAWPLTAFAQQPRQSRRLGVLVTTAENDPEWNTERTAFLEAMQSLGWTDGANLRIDYRFAAGDRNRLAAASKELVTLKPDVLLARSTIAVRALLAETRTIPVIFVSAADPLGEKFAASLARPGGNATGFTNVEATMGGKWLELLKELAPHLQRVGVLFNPRVAVAGGSFFVQPIEAAAPAFALTLDILPVHSVGEMEDAVAVLAREPNSALVVPPDVFMVANRALVIELAARHRLPAVYAFRNMAVEGGLMSYGVDVADLYRRSAAYVDRVLRGAQPGELPIQAPTGFELVLNLKTAKAIGLEVPREFLLRTNEVIE